MYLIFQKVNFYSVFYSLTQAKVTVSPNVQLQNAMARHRGHHISFPSFLSEFVTHSFSKRKIPGRAQMARGSFCRGKTVRSRFSLHATSEWLHEWLINESAHGCTLLSHEEGLYTPDVWYTMCL